MTASQYALPLHPSIERGVGHAIRAGRDIAELPVAHANRLAHPSRDGAGGFGQGGGGVLEPVSTLRIRGLREPVSYTHLTLPTTPSV